MKIRIVKLNEIRKCPKLILSASHWIPEHKIEECNDDLIKKVEKKKEELKATIEEKEIKVEKELEKFKKSLRV